MVDHPNIADVLLSAVQAFDYAGFDTPQMDARLLLCHAAGISHAQLISIMQEPASTEMQRVFASLVSRRLANEPVHRIIGMREFYGRDFILGPDALIPRPDTETLVDVVLEKIGDHGQPLSILDLGTGSGVIALTLACEFSKAQVTAVDVSDAVLENCQENSKRLGVVDRVTVLKSDMFENVDGAFDLIVSNPPYIPTKDIKALSPEVRLYDPERALDGGTDGLDFYRQIFSSAQDYLKQGAMLIVEFGIGQTDDISQLATNNGFENLEVHYDLGSLPRVLSVNLG